MLHFTSTFTHKHGQKPQQTSLGASAHEKKGSGAGTSSRHPQLGGDTMQHRSTRRVNPSWIIPTWINPTWINLSDVIANFTGCCGIRTQQVLRIQSIASPLVTLMCVMYFGQFPSTVAPFEAALFEETPCNGGDTSLQNTNRATVAKKSVLRESRKGCQQTTKG
jgi:hypothetical protein